jgi:hypothetical protein
MALRLPVLRSVDRSSRIEPFVIPDAFVQGGTVVVSSLDVLYGALPGDPPPLLRPICAGRACSARPAAPATSSPIRH